MYVFKNSLAKSEFSVLACYPAAPSKRIKVLQYRCGNPSWMFHCSSKLLSRTFHTSWTSDAWEAVHKLFLSSRSAQKHPEFTTIWSPAHMLRWWHAKDRHGPTYNADQWPSSGKSLVLLQETTEKASNWGIFHCLSIVIANVEPFSKQMKPYVVLAACLMQSLLSLLHCHMLVQMSRRRYVVHCT